MVKTNLHASEVCGLTKSFVLNWN